MSRLKQRVEDLEAGLETEARIRNEHVISRFRDLAERVEAVEESIAVIEGGLGAWQLPAVTIREGDDGYNWAVYPVVGLRAFGVESSYKAACKAAFREALGVMLGVPVEEPKTEVGEVPIRRYCSDLHQGSSL